MKATSLLFFSSSPIALPLFEALLTDSRFKVLGLICQPDKNAGRPEKLTAPVTKLLAQKYAVPVYQPEKLSQDRILFEQLAKNPPDFLLTFAYGQFLPEQWLKLPRYEAFNVHPSLLPKYRGPAPLQAVLLHGEKESGITLMKMVKEMDAGPILVQHVFPLMVVNAGELFEEVSHLAKKWIPEDILSFASKNEEERYALFVEQDSTLATYCEKFSKEDSFENFKRPLELILRRFAAYTPWPGLWTTHQGKRLKLLNLSPSEYEFPCGVVKVMEGRLFVGTQTQAVELLEVQLEGKIKLPAQVFLRGLKESLQTLPTV